MIEILNNKSACFGCGACKSVCPVEAISMTYDAEGFLYPGVDTSLCIDCGLCNSICPGEQPPERIDGQAYAVRCNDLELLKKSSSGGAFSLLAKQVIDDGGLVCGAVFDENFKVCHIISHSIEPMRKSKYVQSDMADIYEDIRSALEEGKQVLFTGTPCQCDGVRRFFGPEKDGLIIAALICRGVQSPGLWKDYVSYISGDDKLESYCFRDKRIKNDAHTVAYTVGGKEKAASMGEDPFSRLFMKCITFRPSCYKCQYTNWELPFDLTIGDFWGIENFRPDLNDGMGTSLVIARTEKGRVMVEKMREKALVVESEREVAEQGALKEPAKETILRKLLFRDFANKNEKGVCDIPLILKKYGG